MFFSALHEAAVDEKINLPEVWFSTLLSFTFHYLQINICQQKRWHISKACPEGVQSASYSLTCILYSPLPGP